MKIEKRIDELVRTGCGGDPWKASTEFAAIASYAVKLLRKAVEHPWPDIEARERVYIPFLDHSELPKPKPEQEQ